MILSKITITAAAILTAVSLPAHAGMPPADPQQAAGRTSLVAQAAPDDLPDGIDIETPSSPAGKEKPEASRPSERKAPPARRAQPDYYDEDEDYSSREDDSEDILPDDDEPELEAPVPQFYEAEIAPEDLRLGIVRLDKKGRIDINGKPFNLDIDTPAVIITDPGKFFLPEAAARLSASDKQELLSDPRRLLASAKAEEFLYINRLLMFMPNGEAIQIDVESLAENVIPKAGKNSEEIMVKRCIAGKGPVMMPVVTNPDSSMFHLPNASHLNKKVRLTPYADVKLAERSGFRPCPICFPQYSSYSGNSRYDRDLSNEASRAIEQKYRISQDRRLISKAEKTGKRVMQANGMDRPMRFVVLDSDELNAFAAATGPVYVTSGLMEALETEDELACVLAHELSHIKLGHMQSQKKRNSWGNALGNVISNAAGYIPGAYWINMGTSKAASLLNQSYSRDQELEADEEGTIMAYAAGYDAEDFLLAITKIGEFSRQNRLERGPDWFRSHPNSDGRRSHIEKTLKKIAPIESKAKQIESAGDKELARYLRSHAKDYFNNPDSLNKFIEAYLKLNI